MHHLPYNLSLCILFLVCVLLLRFPSCVLATCEQCALTGNCTEALPWDRPGTFCSATTVNNQTTYLCCPLGLDCLPLPSQPATLACQQAPSTTPSSSPTSNTSTSLDAHTYVSYAFIAVSLLFAAFLAVLICCVCCNVLLAYGKQWKRQRRRNRGMKGVMPIESEEERRDREQREQQEREELERQQEQRADALLKEERLQRERLEMDAIVQRAREQVERRKRERQQAALDAAVDASEDQRTTDGRKGDPSETEEGAVHCVEEIELGSL